LNVKWQYESLIEQSCQNGNDAESPWVHYY